LALNSLDSLNRKKSKRINIRQIKGPTMVALTISLFSILILVASLLIILDSPKSITFNTQLSSPGNSATINPLDQLASASIALTVARTTNLPETTAITNQSDSEQALLSFAPSYDGVLAKSQVVATKYISNKDIKTYVVQPNETIASIAQKFGISTNSILWSNNITGNEVSPGVKLLIPPITGIVYVVKAGDTPASLAKKFQSNTNLIIAYNDAEISGLHVGERIIIPNGVEPAAINYDTINSATYGFGSQATYGYNGYDFGECTWWVAKLRAEAGDPLPTDLGNAATWGIRAAEFGLPVGTTPAVGAAVVTNTVGYGHVAYVTAVHSNGTITISEMNRIGWDEVDSRIISSAGREYIYA